MPFEGLIPHMYMFFDPGNPHLSSILKPDVELMMFLCMCINPALSRVILHLSMAKGGGEITPTHIPSSKPHRNEIPAATPYFRPYQTQIWHCRHCARPTDIRNSKCRQKPEVIFTSGCPPMSNRVGQCLCCLKVVAVTVKCGVCRWDFANISFHSRDPVFFRFTVHHLEFRMIQTSDNIGNGTGVSGVVENRGR